MALNQQFHVLVSQLRDELGQSTSASVAATNNGPLKQAIKRTYEQLYDEFDWPHLKLRKRISLQAGERYYDFPDDINFDRIIDVSIWYSGVPHPLHRGIGPEHFASFDSEGGDRSEPTIAWDFKANETDTSASPQFEVWPVPNSNDLVVEITGIRNTDRLVNDDDICRLDDNLVVMFTAAQLLRRQKSPDADDMAGLARKRFDTLTGRGAKAGRPRFRMGLGSNDQVDRSTATVRVG